MVYVIFLLPAHNPVEIFCPIPPQFYINDPVTNETVTRTLVLFAPVIIRTTLMWTMFVANLILLVAAIFTWLSDTHSRGLKLLKKLPSVKITDEVLFKLSDLSFLMKLVHANRERLQFVKLVLHPISLPMENQNFLGYTWNGFLRRCFIFWSLPIG